MGPLLPVPCALLVSQSDVVAPWCVPLQPLLCEWAEHVGCERGPEPGLQRCHLCFCLLSLCQERNAPPGGCCWSQNRAGGAQLTPKVTPAAHRAGSEDEKHWRGLADAFLKAPDGAYFGLCRRTVCVATPHLRLCRAKPVHLRVVCGSFCQGAQGRQSQMKPEGGGQRALPTVSAPQPGWSGRPGTLGL